MRFSVVLLLAFVVYASNACTSSSSCESCLVSGCKFSLMRDKSTMCINGNLKSAEVVYTAQQMKHCATMNRIMAAYRDESTTTSESPPRGYLPPKLLPLSTFDETTTTTIPIIKIPTTKVPTTTTTTAKPTDPSTTTPIRTTTTLPPASKQSIEVPPAVAHAPTLKSSGEKKNFTYFNRNGIVGISLGKPQSEMPTCKSVQYSDKGLFEKIAPTSSCQSKISVEELYMRTLCALAEISTPDGLLPMDRIYLESNSALLFNHTCVILKWRKKYCINGKTISVPKALQKEKKRRQTNIFMNVTNKTCQKEWKETQLEMVARMSCRARALAALIPATQFSHVDMVFELMSPTYGFEDYCVILFHKRKNCYFKM